MSERTPIIIRLTPALADELEKCYPPNFREHEGFYSDSYDFEGAKCVHGNVEPVELEPDETSYLP